MEEIVNHEKTLDAKIQNITPYRKQWLIETNCGKWIAKRISGQRTPLWLVKVSAEIQRRGFRAMPTLKTDGVSWVYSSYIPGRTSTYTNAEEVSRMMTTLAEFHEAGQRVFAPSKKSASFVFYQRLYRRLVQYYHVLNNVHKVQGELGNLIRVHGKEFYFDGLLAWEELQRAPLREMTNQEREMGNLAHRDLASHNWIIDGNDAAWLIDWDTVDYDLQLGDVWQMSARVLTENSWTNEWIQQVFVGYEELRPFTSLEKEVLKSLLAFPNEFYREVIGLAHKKKGYKEENVLKYLKKIISSRHQWRKQVKRLGNW